MYKNKPSERDGVQVNYSQTSADYMAMPTQGCGCNSMERPSCMPACPAPMTGMSCPPICECPQNQVCHRVINYEVPHIMPCHTTTVNHHVYNHTYTPVYTYSEVDEVENVYQNRCCR